MTKISNYQIKQHAFVNLTLERPHGEVHTRLVSALVFYSYGLSLPLIDFINW